MIKKVEMRVKHQLCHVFHLNLFPDNVNDLSAFVHRFEIVIQLYFLPANGNCQLTDQTVIASSKRLKFSIASLLVTLIYNFISSANNLERTTGGKRRVMSLINNRTCITICKIQVDIKQLTELYNKHFT